MFYLDEYLAKILMERRVEEAQREAEIDRVLRGARLVHESRFSRERRRLLHRLGHLLVELGERLGQRTYRQTLEVAGSVSSEPCREPCL